MRMRNELLKAILEKVTPPDQSESGIASITTGFARAERNDTHNVDMLRRTTYAGS